MDRRKVPIIILASLTVVAIGVAFVLSFWGTGYGLQPFTLPSHAKVLFILPHPDDEVITAGGVISELAKMDCELTFVYLTNGENFEWAAEEEADTLLLRPQEYLKFGYERQVETERALEDLGLTNPKLIFLGYPDRNLTALVREYWSSHNPLYSKQLKTNKTPFFNSFNPQAVFSGECLLHDLKRLLAQEPWDMIFLPSPHDSHPDHRAAAAFSRMALEETRENLGNSPTLVSYLVHRGNWPGQKGKSRFPLLPPSSMRNQEELWTSFHLTPEALARKERALNQYKSQLRILSGYLFSFLRPNELFSLDTPLVLQNEVTVWEPTADTFWRTVFKGADFKSLSFSWENGLKLKIETSGSFPRTFDLEIHILSFKNGAWNPVFVKDAFRTLKELKGTIERTGKRIEAFIPMERPQAFVLAISSRYWVNIDRSAYWLIKLP